MFSRARAHVKDAALNSFRVLDNFSGNRLYFFAAPRHFRLPLMNLLDSEGKLAVQSSSFVITSCRSIQDRSKLMSVYHECVARQA
jgi:hypothetical protein